MAIKNVPVGVRHYHKSMLNTFSKKREEALTKLDELNKKIKVEHDEIKSNLNVYKDICGVNLLDYDEFVNNKYINGKFLKLTKGMYMNRSNNYELVSDLFNVYNLAIHQKQISELEKEVSLYDKCLKLKPNDYFKVLRTFYTEVHKQMIINGYGYAYTGRLGWVCVNRVVIKGHRKQVLDWQATKKREAELRAQGKRIYNKEEAEWCAKNGIEYKAEDKRVYMKPEFYYELCLCNCQLPNATGFVPEFVDYRAAGLRGKTNQDLINDCHNNVEEITQLPIDLKTKVILCNKVDPILYTKFIRNETQATYTKDKSSYWKNRQ